MRQSLTELRIRDLGKIVTGRTPSTTHPSYFGDKFPFITPSDMDGRKKASTTERYLSDEGAELLKNNLIPENSVAVSCIGWQMGKSIIVTRPSFTNQQLNTIIPNEKVDANFLYYSLSMRRDELLSIGSATGVRTPILNKSAFSDLKILLPPLTVQRRIADILSAYDDLIENNIRRIRILEQTAQAIYQEWFGKVNKDSLLNGWEQKGLFEIADITYGFPFASKMFSTEPTGTPVIRIRDILGNSTNTYTTESTDEKYIVKAGDILVGMDGDFHMCKWANKEAYLNQRVVRFRPKNGISKYFLFLALQEPIHYYNQIIVGTTVAHLGDSHLKSIRILVPDKKFLEKVKEALDPIYELEISLRQKNVNLRQTRDLLLPRLVSGEVDVSSLS